MLKTLVRLALAGLAALLTTGCWIVAFPIVRSVPVPAYPLGPGGPPTPAVPAIYLEYAGNQVMGLQSSFNWSTSSSSMTGSTGMPSSWPPRLPATLTAPAGASVDIVVGYATPPAALWLVELDSQGVPTASAALKPTSATIAYTPAGTGPYTLQVTAQWSYQNYVTYLFALDMTP